MIAVKANRQYTITEADIDAFVKEGYDIYDTQGNIIRYGTGKSVSFDKYASLMKDYEALMEENASLTDKIAKLEADKKASRGRKKAEEKKSEEKEE